MTTSRVATSARTKNLALISRYMLLMVFAIFFLFPIVFMVVSSLKPDDQLLRDTSSLRAFIPYGDISLDNYFGVFERVPAARFIANSLAISAITVSLGLVVNSMAGFALSRTRFRGQQILMALIIATLILPMEAIAIPMLMVVSRLPTISMDGGLAITQGWLNTYHVQILPFVANAFSVFLFTQYFKSIPKELDEAALIDGASWFQIYRKIALPLSGPAFATVAILTFLPTWNSYLWPLLVVQQEDMRPVMLGVTYFFQLDVAWGEIMAYLTMITIPVLAVFLAFQRAFIESIASSGVKG
ncbi:MAG: carbohydrate ABC transporter permease [Acidimicrobiales bacterium]